MGEDTDIAVIGAGPGGYVAAARAAQLGASVTLLEMADLGGTCTNLGCIPSKALLHTVEVLDLIRRADEDGLEAQHAPPHLARIMAQKDRVVKRLRDGVGLLMKEHGVRVVRARARLEGPTTIVAHGPDGEQRLQARKVILATGSAPSFLPIPGAHGKGVITSDDAVRLQEIPASLTIIGGGYVGVEMGYVYRMLGSTVTILELMPQIMPNEDPETVSELDKALRKRGIRIITSARVTRIEDAAAGKVVAYLEQGVEKMVQSERVLMAVGRAPYTQGLGLEERGVEFHGRAIQVNARMETNLPNLYAIGDVIGKIPLAHVASAEGKVAAANACGANRSMRYDAVPFCVYTKPELASVGLSEAAARDAGREVRVGRFPFVALGKAVAIHERTGFVKIVTDARSKVVLGAQIVGPHASDLIAELTLAVRMGVTAEQLADTIHAHPSLPEAVLDAAEDALGHPIHA